MDIGCVDVSYDITEPQPQLFVTPNFSHLHKVLNELSERLSFRRGGLAGLNEALRAGSVNTVELNSGLQISGVLQSFFESNEVCFLKFSGPSQLSLEGAQLENQGKNHHPEGYSTPLGVIKEFDKDLSHFSNDELRRIGCAPGMKAKIEFQSGITLTGDFVGQTRKMDRPLLLSFENCSVKRGDGVLFDPTWGTFDLACGSHVASVFGGPADREAYGDLTDFTAARVPAKNFSEGQKSLFSAYSKHKNFREQKTMSPEELEKIWMEFKSLPLKSWLAGLEVIELAQRAGQKTLANLFESELLKLYPTFKSEILDGIQLAKNS
ncbi:hypothetical protein GW916_13980 [bacterium]|nr:hypothetical protein [bacterium]